MGIFTGKESTNAPHEQTNESSSDDTAYEWDLDDAQDEVIRASNIENKRLLENALQAEPSAHKPAPTGRLHHPVILPQRRPQRRHRGFIRAYAPDLLACGIDQPTFMAFLDEFDKSMMWSPLADIINLSTVATFAIPGGYGAAVSLPIQIVTGVYKELNGRKGQNAFLQKMNAELFRPRGLFAMVVAHSSTSAERITPEDIAASAGARAHGSTSLGDKFRNADGKYGPLDFPESAELVFPGLEGAADGNGNGNGQESAPAKNGFARAMERYGAHRDRKRTAKWIRKHPDTPLEALMDPAAAERAREKGMKKPKKRRLARNILYLMITNLPSEEEMLNAMKVEKDVTKQGSEEIK
ncbi:hypothetical protein F5Y19DRAFT_429761 [Xylariaceae sp. FL1651]|nr:hypothetical protein F5Y19DRAFT_429761 [Xylariaceae sp. FL1651]